MNAAKAAALAAVAAFALAAAPAPAAAGPHWHGGYGGWGHHGGWGWGAPALAFGIVGAALAAGVAAEECIAFVPVYDDYGNYVGRRRVNRC